MQDQPATLANVEDVEQPKREASLAAPTLFGIIPQTQPSAKTCVQTCLAMALGVHVSKVIDRYGNGSMNQAALIHALSECGFIWNQMTTGMMVHQGWYFAAVPSLNHRGGMHEILIHYTQDDGLLLLDPALGESYKPDGSDLKSWADLTPFWPGGRMPNAEVKSADPKS